MAAIEYQVKRAGLLGGAARAVGRGALNFGKGFAAPFVQNAGNLAKPLVSAAKTRFGESNLANLAWKGVKNLPRTGLNWERKTGVPGMVGNYLGGMSMYGALPLTVATAMGGDKADGAALALGQLRQQYSDMPWYQRAFGGGNALDSLILKSDPKVLEALRRLYGN